MPALCASPVSECSLDRVHFSNGNIQYLIGMIHTVIFGQPVFYLFGHSHFLVVRVSIYLVLWIRSTGPARTQWSKNDIKNILNKTIFRLIVSTFWPCLVLLNSSQDSFNFDTCGLNPVFWSLWMMTYFTVSDVASFCVIDVWNVTPLIRRGSNLYFFAAIYCSCLGLNCPTWPPDKRGRQ